MKYRIYDRKGDALGFITKLAMTMIEVEIGLSSHVNGTGKLTMDQILIIKVR